MVTHQEDSLFQATNFGSLTESLPSQLQPWKIHFASSYMFLFLTTPSSTSSSRLSTCQEQQIMELMASCSEIYQITLLCPQTSKLFSNFPKIMFKAAARKNVLSASSTPASVKELLENPAQ
ncbi:hypothetical protein OUZ56_020618 [Daphnia magna]|uniref:Uncharacterized protein n=1 Tax=Daphnia magna TaxID=35525 RepID=A0ABQ9ZEY8_9CRUS|nr:hypothetical protein OUZ56_020618 [Daphnia magna]